ncbi:multidrug effflux MFS transporter [Rhodoplanes sp. TEM]|uniref:Bcr/CflA family efflux transporter n=1 Tax=Rhodoplanes tepidamans TaxID=200616 RepID=A0ABT5JHH9_RHOTP|nr:MULTISPECIES: multidrug effflux MFS transporter [Rhodoplanes]MDC7789042.1 multidrug effflux MFS transporter [Rhodoplanes tepidamans]MDC7983777.1 multidrug effflux MFS transporter [Rhodoplanes sp. TEM]MDQ0354925.1 DHA1 family bicyclomycin/chloramphenicol resistance-like MFS transporter [Rhodoplanes tepidamans]
MLRPDTFALTALLALLTALGPLAMDLYLPSFPEIGRTLAATPSQVQLTISFYMLGFAVGQLFFGPISDRFGRKPVLSFSLVVFCVGTLACALAPTITTLIAARVLQGAGAAGVIVLARTVVRDLYEGARAAREMALMGAIMGFAPILAPMVGGVLEEWLGWRAGFVLILVAGIAAMSVVGGLLPETVPPSPKHAKLVRGSLESFGIILKNKAFLAYLGIVTATFSGLFSYISGSPFVMQSVYGLSPTGFGLFYGVTSLGFISGTLTAAHVVMRLGFDRTIGIGATGVLVGGLGSLAAVGFAPHSMAALAAALAVFLFGFGMAMPQAQAGTLQPFPERAGAASSLVGGVQQTVGAAVGAVVGLALGATAWPMVIAIALTGVATFAIWITTRKVRAAAHRRHG